MRHRHTPVMSRIFLFGFLLFCAGIGALSATAQTASEQPSARWSAGDNASWMQPAFDDSQWGRFDGAATPNGIFWIRDRYTIPENAHLPANSIFVFEGTGAFEVYVDGTLLGSTGIVGETPSAETPGASRFSVAVPREFLAVGEHVLALRASAEHLRDPSDLFVTYSIEPANQLFSRNSLNLVMLGAVLAAVGLLSIFFATSSSTVGQRRIFVAALTTALGIAVITAIETGELLGLFPYTWINTADLLAMVSAAVVFIALPSLLLMRLGIEKQIFWLAGLAVVVLVSAVPWGPLPYEHDTRTFIALCFYCLAICTQAPAPERRHAIYYAICIGACLTGIFLDPQYLFVFLVMLALLLTLGHALHIRGQELVAKQTELTAARLESEMLKRNLQPHFMMNSLTAITEWIETAPQDALRFVNGLADEFRSLSKLSGKRLAPLEDELELCRTHLELMGMRRKRRFTLVTTGLEGDEKIPPGIFHTLIENALSHNRYSEADILFELSKSMSGEAVVYTMIAPLGEATEHKEHSTGSGTNYVKARLEESYAGRWRLRSGSENGAWITTIWLMA
jgi:histidine kinase